MARGREQGSMNCNVDKIAWIASVTSRWDTYAGDSGAFLSNDELRNILGDSNFNKLFVYP